MGFAQHAQGYHLPCVCVCVSVRVRAVSEVTSIVGVTGTPSTATVGVRSTIEFNGPFVRDGDAAKFVHGSATHCHDVPARPWETMSVVDASGRASFTFSRASMVPEVSISCTAGSGNFRVSYAGTVATFGAADSAECAAARVRSLTGDVSATVDFLPPPGGSAAHVPSGLCSAAGVEAFVVLDGASDRLDTVVVDAAPAQDWFFDDETCSCPCGTTGPQCDVVYTVTDVPCTDTPVALALDTTSLPNVIGNSAPDAVFRFAVSGPASVVISTCNPATAFDT